MNKPTLDLEPIKARAGKATEGPWRWLGRLVLAGERGVTVVSGWKPLEGWFDNCHPNLEFIANSRTDIPALVAEVERLRAVMDEIAAMSSGVSDRCLGLGLHSSWAVVTSALAAIHQHARVEGEGGES
jgi:hypothetical protein